MSIPGALGSVIGYLGAEVAQPAIFERLLWPQRFYFEFNPKIFLIQVFLLPMGGPLHRVALQTLDTFHEHGLYLGSRRGNMLGTNFYADLQTKYFARTIADEKNLAKDVRNGFWVLVLQNLRTKTPAPAPAAISPRYAAQPVHHLILQPAVVGQATSSCIRISETSVSWRSFAGVFSSELSAIAVAIAIGVHRKSIWVAYYLCVPLLLKFLAIFSSVRRTPIKNAPDASSAIFEIDDPHHGFAVIEGSPDIVRQFFRHYGHPIRARPREVASLVIVYLFLLYFPAGLLGLFWMDPIVQYYWLGYQVYTVLAMHIARLASLGGCGRTEIRVAEMLSDGKTVILESHGGDAVSATVSTEEVASVDEGKTMILKILQKHQQKLDTADTPSGGKMAILESPGGDAVSARVSTEEVASVDEGETMIPEILQKHQQKPDTADKVVEEKR